MKGVGAKLAARAKRCAKCALPVVLALWVVDGAAQIPIPTQEQIQLFNSLPPAQQRALIQELQEQLPPAQREAMLRLLQQQAPQAAAPPPEDAQRERQTPVLQLPGQMLAPEGPPRLAGGDTVVIEFTLRPDAPPAAPAGATTSPEQQPNGLLQRLADGNPYRLDADGQLYLPGIPAIALAGLTVEEATVRLRAEPGLRRYDVEVTLLPLEPVGVAALEPFGYDLFTSSTTPVVFEPPADIPAPVGYVVGPGDTINVQLFGNQNAEYFLIVSREGAVNFPQIGPINVAGLTFDEARETISQRIAQQMIGVQASITLGELRSIRVFVLGDVEQPGSHAVGSLSTITSALLESGGVKTIGSLRNVQLRREGNTVATLDLYDLLLRGDTTNDLRLQPGDVIFVPPIGDTVAIGGEVRRPAIYEIRNERTVAQVVTLAGGLTPVANRAAVKLERVAPGRGTTVRDINIGSQAGAGEAVQNGDVIRVLPNLTQLEGAVRLEGNVYQPGLYQWFSGMRLSDLLPSPELVKPLSDLNYVLIRREIEPNVFIEPLSADLAAIWERRPNAIDPVLQARDTVYVFNLEIGRQHILQPMIEALQAQAPPNQPLPVVRVAGQVRAPGEYPLEPNMTVSDLLRAGGGLSSSAYVIDAELTRYAVVNGEYRETALVDVDLASLMQGNAVADIALSPYDYLSVKEVPRWREQEEVTIRGEVVFPGSYPIRPGETLGSVLERAGGLTQFAFPEGSVFTREELREREREQIETLARRIENELAAISLSDPQATEAISIGQSLVTQLRNAQATGRLVVSLDLIQSGAATDIVLEDGDQLLVPDAAQEVTVLGEVQYATSHVFQEGLTRDEYIARSGGVTPRADARRIYVVRANGEVIADSGPRWFRRDQNVEIRPGDTIVIPLDVDRVRPLARWSSVTSVVYNLAIAAAAVNSF